MLSLPYPSPRVTMWRVSVVSGGFCGENQPRYALRYAGDPYVIESSTIEVRVDEECVNTFDTIAHEVAHTWFHGNDPADWIDEGLANAVENQIVAANQHDETVYPPVTYCESYRNIRELELAAPRRVMSGQYSGFGCNYSLGDGIFGALLEHYGSADFNQRISQMARRSVNQTDRAHNIADVRQIFGDDSTALAIVDTWYEGQPEMRKYRHLDAVDWTFPPTIDGEYLHFAGKTSQPGTVHDFVLGDHPYCSQFSLYDGIGDQEWVGSVSDPLQVGWSYNEVPKLVAVHGSISPDNGEFSVTARIHDNAVDSIAELSLLVMSRISVGNDGFCLPIERYSQVAVVSGGIPDDLKVANHYHQDAIQWTDPPTISGTTLTFIGETEPGTVSLNSRDEYCAQFSLYERDESGYHYIVSLSPLLPENMEWTNPQPAELVKGWTYTNGKFNATAKISADLLSRYPDLILVVRTAAEVDEITNKCGDSEVLSAVDIQRN